MGLMPKQHASFMLTAAALSLGGGGGENLTAKHVRRACY